MQRFGVRKKYLEKHSLELDTLNTFYNGLSNNKWMPAPIIIIIIMTIAVQWFVMILQEMECIYTKSWSNVCKHLCSDQNKEKVRKTENFCINVNGFDAISRTHWTDTIYMILVWIAQMQVDSCTTAHLSVFTCLSLSLSRLHVSYALVLAQITAKCLVRDSFYHKKPRPNENFKVEDKK